jgi:nicotinamide riboside kinase
MLKKIAITGPESCGKTTLCQQLAEHFQCLWVPEMARIVLEKEGPAYDAAKVEFMACMQLEEEQRLEKMAIEAGHEWLFFDTDFLVYQIWMEQRFGFCPDWIRQQAGQPNYALRILLRPDLPWQPDPLRENPHNRDFLYGQFELELVKNNLKWKSLGGAERLTEAIRLMTEISV